MPSKTSTNNLKSVLIVDDDAELCALIGEVLKATAEFQVEAVHDGRRGLALALEPRFDLIILDVMLPVVDGFEVLKQIRKRSRVPVMLLTSRTERQDPVTGLDAGADDYLPKPFWPEELMARVRAVLRRSLASSVVKPRSLAVGGGIRGSFGGRHESEHQARKAAPQRRYCLRPLWPGIAGYTRQ